MIVKLRCGWAFALLVGLVGCQRAEELRYVSSKQVQELSAELQAKIVAELEKHCGTPRAPKLIGSAELSPEYLKLGAAVFQKRCATCHGVTGDGQGVATGPNGDLLIPRPRDYRRGIFKFTSTPYGAKPLRDDLVRIVKIGARGTSMPAFHLLPDEELQAVVDYVLVLAHRGELEFQLYTQAEQEDAIDPSLTEESIGQILDQWNAAREQVVLPLTKPVPYSEESVALGKKAFLSEIAGCYKCHGEDGRGNTKENRGEDAWGHPARAADLTAAMFHGGARPEDIYRRIYAGINGSPMPSFELKLKETPDEFWHLVNYVQYISSARRREVVKDLPVPKKRAVSSQTPAEEQPQARVKQASSNSLTTN